MRISDWSSDVCSSDLGLQNIPLTVTPIAYAEGLKVKDDRLSWKASVSWKPVDSLTTYATVSTGFRTPVVNARAGLVSAIDPDDLVIPEGAKSDSVKIGRAHV